MVACPQLAEADIRPLDGNSVFDPWATLAPQICCDAQPAVPPPNVVAWARPRSGPEGKPP